MQIENGIRKILDNSFIYNFSQNIIGANRLRKIFVEQHLKVKNGMTVCDLGCGTAEILRFLPKEIEYFGCDISEKYLEHAKSMNYNNAKFFTINQSKIIFKKLEFDLFIGIGLLHHLDDNEVTELLEYSYSKLKKGGRFISIDPCYIKNQFFISKYLIKNDRGQNVRTLKEMKSLILSDFKKNKIIHKNNLLRIPYDHVILELIK